MPPRAAFLLRRRVHAVFASIVVALLLRTCVTRKETLFTHIKLHRPFRPVPNLRQRSCARQALPEDQLGKIAVQASAAYTDALVVDPVTTKMYTAALVVALGDAVSQLQEASETGKQYDVPRGVAFAVFGALYTGAFQHWWFLWLNENVPSIDPSLDFSQALLVAVTKTCLCQFGTIPLVYIPLFFALTGLLRGLTLQQTWDRACSLFLPLLRRNVTFWIPVQTFQFLAVDLEWQVPYVCAAGFVWSIILSNLTGPMKETEQSAASAPMYSSK